MQPAETLGTELTPDEASYFDSEGATAIPEGGEAAEVSGAGGGAPASAADGDKEQRPEKMVALAALHEERSRRREIDRQYREAQQQLAELRGRFAAIESHSAPPPQPPKPEEDIYGAVKATTDAVAELRERLENRDARDRVAQREQSVIAAYRSDAAQFEARTPDFRAAYSHLLASRAQELAAMGYDDPQAVHQALMADEFAVAQAALARRQSPAEIIYTLARQRGFTGDAASAARGRGGERLASIERGQQVHKSLAAAGGAGGDADISAEALLKMPMDEFEAWCAKNPARARRIMGG